MKLEQGDVVLCKVDKIQGTTVFVTILDDDNKQGVIITSEISPGRIRNIRDFVVPNKRIVCKILDISKDSVHLSLRRVTSKERKEVLDNYKKEQSAMATIKSILKEQAEKVIEKIKSQEKVCEFLEKSKTNPKLLEEHMDKEQAEKIYKIICQKKEKQIQVKKEFSLKTNSPDGIITIKKILSISKDNLEITYVAAGRFNLKIKAENYKEANSQINNLLEEIEKKAKEEKAEFSYKK